MKLVFLGSGNIATTLGRLAKKNGHEIAGVFSRNPEHAMELAKQLETVGSSMDISELPEADIYIIAISDTALKQGFERLDFRNGLVVHTAGSVSAEVLKPYSTNYGVLYPMQSLRKNMEHLPDIPLLIDASNEVAYNKLSEFALSLGQKVSRANDEQRLKLHISAVFACNFTNYLYAVADKYCKNNGLDFSMLQPLIEETAGRIRTSSPAAVQTGPAHRRDEVTIQKHLELLENQPEMREIYKFFTDAIQQNLK